MGVCCPVGGNIPRPPMCGAASPGGLCHRWGGRPPPAAAPPGSRGAAAAPGPPYAAPGTRPTALGGGERSEGGCQCPQTCPIATPSAPLRPPPPQTPPDALLSARQSPPLPFQPHSSLPSPRHPPSGPQQPPRNPLSQPSPTAAPPQSHRSPPCPKHTPLSPIRAPVSHLSPTAAPRSPPSPIPAPQSPLPPSLPPALSRSLTAPGAGLGPQESGHGSGSVPPHPAGQELDRQPGPGLAGNGPQPNSRRHDGRRAGRGSDALEAPEGENGGGR